VSWNPDTHGVDMAPIAWTAPAPAMSGVDVTELHGHADWMDFVRLYLGIGGAPSAAPQQHHGQATARKE
jgi:hypothetical protein